MKLIKRFSNGKINIAMYKRMNGIHQAYIVNNKEELEVIVVTAWCPNWLEETLMNRYDGLKVRCEWCEQFIEANELFTDEDDNIICKDRNECNIRYQTMLNTV